MYVMATVPKKYVPEGRTWLQFFRNQDCHKWIIALEHGSQGLVHWQLRWKQRGIDTKEGRLSFFNSFKLKCPEAHIEFTENWCDYERKEGMFVCSDDSREVLGIRFGKMRPNQREMLWIARSQNDRQIDVWYDRVGNHGKSWLSLHLAEKGEGLLVPRYCTTARALSQYICSSYAGQQYIIIDIPRAGKISRDLYETIEEIKDGAVFDERYTGKWRNVRGSKVLVFTNQKLDTGLLSKDRWRLHGMNECP